MIMVVASWEDQSGTMQSTRARIENKSSGGACIRLNKKIVTGTKVRIEGQWERFSGEARYCRQDGRDYLVGIQKDKTHWSSPKRLAGQIQLPKGKGILPDVEALMGQVQEGDRAAAVEIPAREERLKSPPKSLEAEKLSTTVVPEHAIEQERWSRKIRDETSENEPEGLVREEGRQPSVEGEASKERKHMRRKWFDMGHQEENQETLTEAQDEKEETTRRAPTISAPMEKYANAEESERGAELELQSVEDIYRVAGIVGPRKGCSINKIVEMLHSEHLRGLSKEMKRASVLMALDAAGVTVEEVLQDAKARQEAIDSYEAEQRKQFEAQLARKAEENVQIQSEMERVKARYTERLRRNLDGMAREKATFGNWLTMKQQEAQSMAEAMELCLKQPAPEKPSTPLEEVSLAGARVKPV
jgi:hypothetical protein